MADRRVVILQPFYLPYVGVFEQVRLADVFVLFDDVQFVRRNWQHRNRIKTAAGPKWLTVPVSGSSRQRLDEAIVREDEGWRRQHQETIRHAYGRAPHVELLLDALDPVYERAWERLVDVNVETFRRLCGLLGVDAEFLRSSDLGVGGSGHARILGLSRELGATHYLSGPSARDYLDEPAFEDAGIRLEYLAFEHPEYRQLHGPFEPFLSVVDLLANEGPASGGIVAGSGRAVAAADWPPTTDR